MGMWSWVGSVILLLFCMMSSVIAEVSIHKHRLTIHVDSVSLDKVLSDLSRNGSIEITVMEQKATAGISVTVHFEGLPIEEGLSRLLADWNYSLIKQPGSGRIQEIFLVSKRNPSNGSSSISHPRSSSPRTESFPRDSHYPDSYGRDFREKNYSQDEGDDEPIDFAREESETEQELFSEDMLPDDLPADLREEILREYNSGE